MLPGNLPVGDSSTKHWPDFYLVLDCSPESDTETLRRAINALYIKANEQSDHRELNTRFYNQVLSQKVLPQCRRILLNEGTRQAYDRQWHLHRDGAESALSYSDFIREISKDAGTARALLLSDDEISLLPGLGASGASHAVSNPAPDAAASEIVEAEEVVEGENVGAADTSLATPDSPLVSNAFVMAPPVSPTRQKNFPVLPLVGVLLVLGIGVYAWNASKTAPQSEAAAPQAVAVQSAPQTQTQTPKVVAAFQNSRLRLNSLALNADFETGTMGAWAASNPNAMVEDHGDRSAKSGNKMLTFWSKAAFDVSATQTIKNLAPGKYTLRAWSRRGGGQEKAEMFAADDGGPKRSVPMPLGWDWTFATLRDIEVKGGSCTIGFHVKAPGLKTVNVDAVEFFRQ